MKPPCQEFRPHTMDASICHDCERDRSDHVGEGPCPFCGVGPDDTCTPDCEGHS